jgi:hypothetical protein
MAALRGPVDAISFSRGKRPMTDRGSAVLDVVRRPIALGRGVVMLVEQCVKSFKDKRFIFRFGRLTHFHPPARSKTLSGRCRFIVD